MTEDKWHKPLVCSLCGEPLRLFNHQGQVESVAQILEFRCQRGHGLTVEIEDDSTAWIHTYVKARG